MLHELHVSDLALIEDARLELGGGMTVLTGETGAGKTVLVGALRLLLGDRADSSLVRQGADAAVVEGLWSTPEGERVAVRRLGADGRSRCSLDGTMSTVGALAEALGGMVDLHGQHDHQALLSPSRHAGYLDGFIGPRAADALAAYRVALAERASAAARLDELRTRLQDRERRLDYLRFQVGEIDAAAPREGEDTEIEAALPSLRHGERLREAASRAHRSLVGDRGAADALADASRALSAVAGLDPELDALGDALSEAAMALDEAAVRLRERAEAVVHDPRELDEAESRLSVLGLLKRKYGPALADVLAARAKAADDIASLEAAEEGLHAATETAGLAEQRLREAAGALGTLRASEVPRFASLLAEAARDLAMAQAEFGVRIEDLSDEAWTRDGPQRVEFTYSPGPGSKLRPLARVASGGEISRVMLALKSVLGRADEVPVLVFDEVDAGIGGATALTVGRRLADLARERQVLVVTHLPQVAAFADAHYAVEKRIERGEVRTVVRLVTGEERAVEIARMLAGSDTDASIAHARELLAAASGGGVACAEPPAAAETGGA